VIVCVGLNPALDRRIVLDALELGGVNRALSAEGSPGGKAANVALAARALGSDVRFVGFLGGPTGRAVELGLAERGIHVDAIATLAPTRINLELIDGRGVTEVLEPGSAPTAQELEQLLERCRLLFEACEQSAVVAFSGSLPAGTATSLYARLIELAKAHGLRIILDTSGVWLERGLSAKPDLVKPNRQEAEALLKRPIETESDAKAAVHQLMALGAGSAIVSLGAAGLVSSANERAFLVKPPTLEARSSVGCGDATVAGLAVALERQLEKPEQLAFAAACGAANCLAKSPGCLDAAKVAELRQRVQTRFLD
jgi:1-phosphofructokinase family hexose kinase